MLIVIILIVTMMLSMISMIIRIMMDEVTRVMVIIRSGRLRP